MYIFQNIYTVLALLLKYTVLYINQLFHYADLYVLEDVFPTKYIYFADGGVSTSSPSGYDGIRDE